MEGIDPDEKRVQESSGNAGVSVEWSYRIAALVIWPRNKAVVALASGGIDNAIGFVEEEVRRIGGGAEPSAEVAKLVSQLVAAWPISNKFTRQSGIRRANDESRCRMLRLLAAASDEGVTSRFLREVVLPRYMGGENDGLVAVASKFGPRAMGGFLPPLVRTKLERRVTSLLELTWRLSESLPHEREQLRRDLLEEAVGTLMRGLPRVFKPLAKPGSRSRSAKRVVFDAQSIERILRIGWLFGLDRETTAAARLLVEHPTAATPDRALPEALSKIRSAGASFSRRQAYWSLWSRSAEFLLGRSATRPEPPTHWRVDVKIGCRCHACRKLKAFCLDVTAETTAFAMREDLRLHLQQKIKSLDLPMDHKTVKRGRPYKLVCTKNRADYKRRLEEHACDLEHMRILIESPPANETIGQGGRLMQRLRITSNRMD